MLQQQYLQTFGSKVATYEWFSSTSIEILTLLKLCLATATHNFNRVKISILWISALRVKMFWVKPKQNTAAITLDSTPPPPPPSRKSLENKHNHDSIKIRRAVSVATTEQCAVVVTCSRDPSDLHDLCGHPHDLNNDRRILYHIWK